ncbi:YheU family protein [Sessilibacter sp. MAH2]
MIIPFDKLPKDILINLVEEFVTREGTDYGDYTTELNDKVEQVIAQLKNKKAFVVYDTYSESTSIVSADDLSEDLE